MGVLNVLTVWSAEISYLLYKTGNFMLDATIRPYIATAVCRELLGPEDPCLSPIFRSQHQDVQDTTSSYLTYYRIILYLPAALLGFYWGAWSDQNGRKLPMIFPNVGAVIGILCYLLIPLFPQHTLLLIILGTSAQGVCCTTHIFKMAVTSYTVELSGTNVGKRLSILVSMSYLGQFLGSLFAGLFQDVTDTSVTLLIASVLHTCSGLYVVCFIKDKHIGDTDEMGSHFKTALSSIQQSIQVVAKRRPGNSRGLIICLCIASMLQSICYIGDMDISVLYLQGKPLEWPESWYGYYLSVEQGLKFLGLAFIYSFLSDNLKLHEGTIMLLSLTLGMLRCITSSFSVHSWMMWMSNLFGILGGINYSIIRHLLSKEVVVNELGKMFSLIESIDIFTRPIGSAMFVTVYGQTRVHYPGMAYQAEAIVYILYICLMAFVKTKS